MKGTLAVVTRPLHFFVFLTAMAVIVTASNILVQFPLNDWVTWGAFTYPVAFLITDLANRTLGPQAAMRVVLLGFAAAVGLSVALATPRIAFASGLAFLVAQLLDVYVFDRLRKRQWWTPPLVSSLIGSAIDTIIFFSVAFAMTGLPWITWAVGDFAIKVLMALLLLIPFGALRRNLSAIDGSLDGQSPRL